jgi:hypothetical protein
MASGKQGEKYITYTTNQISLAREFFTETIKPNLVSTAELVLHPNFKGFAICRCGNMIGRGHWILSFKFSLCPCYPPSPSTRPSAFRHAPVSRGSNRQRKWKLVAASRHAAAPPSNPKKQQLKHVPRN